MNHAERITFDPEQCGGRPCIRGMCIRVKDVLEMLAAGVSEAQILQDFPYLESDDIRASLEFAAAEMDHSIPRPITTAFWYPFRSRQVAEITANLTADESLSLQSLSHENGTWWGYRIGIIAVCSVLLGDHLAHTSFERFAVSMVSTLIVTLILCLSRGGLKTRQKMKDFLCSTEFAKHADFRPDSIRLNQYWFR